MRLEIRNVHINFIFVGAMLRLSVCMANTNGITSMNLEKATTIQKRHLPSHTTTNNNNNNNNNPRSHAGLTRRRRNRSVRAGDDINRRRGSDARGSKRGLEGEEANAPDIYYRKYYEEQEQEDAEVEEGDLSNTLAENQEGLENIGTSTSTASETASNTDSSLEEGAGEGAYYYDETVYYYFEEDTADADKGEGEGGNADVDPVDIDVKNQVEQVVAGEEDAADPVDNDLKNQVEQVADEEEDYYITKTTYYYYEEKEADDAGLTTLQSDESQLDQMIQTRHYPGDPG